MNTIAGYFPGLSENQLHMLELLKKGYLEWNDKINVISRKDTGHIEERHLLHSLSIARFMSFAPGTEIIDIGTGGGLPGLPLAVVFPDCRFTLVDSIGKKIRVVEELIRFTGLKNVKAEHERAEKISRKFDFVTGRAVTAFPKFLEWTRHLPGKRSFNERPNGYILLKGGDLSQELMPFRHQAEIHPVSQWYSEQWFREKYIVYMPGAL